ncbi:MAG: universal stress protein [Rhodospirillales bacterium]|nr:universal stress protein [Rhodospirillales bacterium]MDE2575179.1 universal stress protein [Rhodospirillales bacterium]
MSFGILAVLNRVETAPAVLAAAASLAGRIPGARLDLLHVRHDVMEDFLASEEVMTRARRQELEAISEGRSAALRQIVARWHGMPAASLREITGRTAAIIVAESAGAALVVVGRAAPLHYEDARQAIHAALLETGRPMLLVPASPAPSAQLGRHVAVAWKPDAPAERLLTAALPILRAAERVSILIAEETGAPPPPPHFLLDELDRAGVPHAVLRWAAAAQEVGPGLLREAHAAGADMLALGAYSRSRLLERIFGGATQHMLDAADLPVLMMH